MNEPFDNPAFKATASRLPEAIVTTDTKGKITWANRAFKTLCGYHLKEVIGQKPGDFLQGPETDPETVKQLGRAVKKKEYFHTEILNYHKKGDAYWADLTVTPYFDSKNKLEGFIAIARDISKKRFEIHQMERDVVAMYKTLIGEFGQSDRPNPNDPFLQQLAKKHS